MKQIYNDLKVLRAVRELANIRRKEGRGKKVSGGIRKKTKNLNKPKKESKTKISINKLAVKGFSGIGTLAGKIPRGKTYSKKQKRAGRWTNYGIEKNGITLATEHRGEATLANAESVMIGHTSMPSKFCAINMWRAILKHILFKMGCEVRDFGRICLYQGFRVGDKFIYYYYSGAGDQVMVNKTYEISTTTTFDSIAAEFAGFLDDEGNLFDDRIDSFVFIPNDSNVNSWSWCKVDLTQLKVAVHTKSSLKIQNVTVENSTDNESDDVTRVPLQGMLYECKGNNFKLKANSKVLPGFYSFANEHTLFEGYTKSNAVILGSTSVGFYDRKANTTPPADSDQTQFYKKSEMPKPWEVANCIRSIKFYVPAGGIRTSVIEKTFEMTLQSYYTLIYTYYSTNNTYLQYNEKQGITKAIFLEKVVGKTPTAANAIKLWTETEFRQSTLVFGGPSTYTLPITYQEDKV